MTDKIRYRRVDDRRVRVVMHDGFEGFMVRWTDACTGCFEYVDGHAPMGSVWDSKAKCHVGVGCHECGYTGKRRREEWVPFNVVEWEHHFNKDWYEQQERRKKARAEGQQVMQ